MVTKTRNKYGKKRAYHCAEQPMPIINGLNNNWVNVLFDFASNIRVHSLGNMIIPLPNRGHTKNKGPDFIELSIKYKK